jgi:hypothetical protein
LAKYIPSKIYVKTNSSMSNSEESSEGGQRVLGRTREAKERVRKRDGYRSTYLMKAY